MWCAIPRIKYSIPLSFDMHLYGVQLNRQRHKLLYYLVKKREIDRSELQKYQRIACIIKLVPTLELG